MQSYGKFEVSRKIGTGQGTVVYAARTGPAPVPEEYAVKVSSPELLLLETDGAALEARTAALAATRNSIELQKAAAAGSPFVAPILDQGQDESQVWYATRFYPRSLGRILRERTRLTGRQVLHLLLGAVRGARAFKQACGRSHGNLKPANLLVAGSARLESATVVVADPLPGGPEQAAACELSDLKAIGQMLYEIVRRKEAAAPEWEELVLPLELSGDWTATFGKYAPRWLTLCNRLLDRQLTLASIDLARLEQELEDLRPKAAVSPILVIAVLAVLGAGGLIAWWLTRPANVGRLTLKSDPPGATLLIDGQPVGSTPWDRKVAASQLSIIASNEFGVEQCALAVVAGRSTNYTFQFQYGQAAITSDPPGASVTDADDRQVGNTPFVTSRLRPGQYSYVLRLTNHHPAAVQVTIPPNGRTNQTPMVTLRRITGPSVSVIVKVEPRELGAVAVITNAATQQGGRAPSVFELKPGRSQFELLLPPPWPRRTFEAQVGTNTEQTIVERVAAGRLDFDSEPSGATVWAGTDLVGVTPTNRLWPTGTFVFEWRLPYHATNRFETNLTDGAWVQRRETLAELLSPVRLVANLEGVRVYATNAQLGRFGDWRVGTAGTNVGLPGTNTLVAEFADPQTGTLAPVILTNAMAARKATNEYRFNFAFGSVSLDTTPRATVSVGGRELTGRPVRRYQIPGEPVTYAFAADHFDSTNLSLVVGNGETLTTNVALKPTLYDVVLEVSPPVAQVRLLSLDLPLTNGLNRLPWGNGRYDLAATYPRLAGATNSITMTERGVTQAISLAYARVNFATKQRGLQVAEGTDRLGLTPLNDVYLPPGKHTFTFASRAGSTNWTTDLARGASEQFTLPFQFMADFLTNSVGLRLAYIPEADIYVQQFETTRAQYSALLPLAADAVACSTPDCPVVLVAWTNAVDFCNKLNVRDAEKSYLDSQDLGGWVYALPTEAEWTVFAPATDLPSEPEAVFANFTGPLPINDARKSANHFRLYDLHGNVAEFCLGADGTTKLLMGGSFFTTKRSIRQVAPEQAINGKAPEVGFRVVLKRAGS